MALRAFAAANARASVFRFQLRAVANRLRPIPCPCLLNVEERIFSLLPPPALSQRAMRYAHIVLLSSPRMQMIAIPYYVQNSDVPRYTIWSAAGARSVGRGECQYALRMDIAPVENPAAEIAIHR